MARIDTRSPKSVAPLPTEESGPVMSLTTRIVMGMVAVVGLVWFMQGEANDMELERELRGLPGVDGWMTEMAEWAQGGDAGESRAVWLGDVDELVRTRPEVGEPELLAVKLVGVVKIAGEADRAPPKLYVTARGFDFVGRGLDEPLSGHRWLVATYENEHDQRRLYGALPVPGAVVGGGGD